MKQFLKDPNTLFPIIIALIYQIIMVGLVMPAYTAMPKQVTELPIAIVNEDEQYGQQIENQLL